MSLVLMRCPESGTMVSTGIETDWFSFGMLPDVSTRSLCSHCGKEHAWRKSDAKLIDAPDARPQISTSRA